MGKNLFKDTLKLLSIFKVKYLHMRLSRFYSLHKRLMTLICKSIALICHSQAKKLKLTELTTSGQKSLLLCQPLRDIYKHLIQEF